MLDKYEFIRGCLCSCITVSDRFPWSWRELGVLNNAAMKLGSLELAEAVRKVAQVTQVKHHGKIKRQDFKTYVMKRGY